jgi:hypothetical protein
MVRANSREEADRYWAKLVQSAGAAELQEVVRELNIKIDRLEGRA